MTSRDPKGAVRRTWLLVTSGDAQIFNKSSTKVQIVVKLESF